MFLQQLVNGLTIGCTYALVAIGYTLVFGILRLINFANNAMYMMGAYVTLVLYLGMGGYFGLAVILSILITGAVGYLSDRFALRRLREKNAPRLAGLISTMGISTVLTNLMLLLFGSEAKPFPNYLDFGSFEIGNAVISWTQVIIFCICGVLMTVLSLFIYKTRFGKAMRATSQNVEAAYLMGIHVQGVISVTFIIAGMMAAVSGILVGTYYQSIDANMSSTMGMKTFASAVLGGIGVLPGAVVGGLLVGVIETIAASYISSGYRNAIAFAILIIVLIIKPSGLFGKQKVDKV